MTSNALHQQRSPEQRGSHTAPVIAARAPAAGAFLSGGHEVIARALAAAREELGLEAAYLTEFHDDSQIVRHTSGDAAAFGLEEGTSVLLEGSYCQRVLDGRMPSVVPDTSRDPEARALAATVEAGLGAYVGVPVRFRDGALYGTLCAASSSAAPELAERDIGFMNVLARMLADTVERERSHELRHEHQRRIQEATTAFFSHLSHELRTPLNSILGFAQLMEIDGPRPQHAEHLTHIREAGNHLLGLLGQTLDMARIEAGKLDLSIEPVSVAAVVAEARNMLAPTAGARAVVIAATTGPADAHVLADRQRLRQVLLNLLSNAIKYGAGKVAVTYEETGSEVRLAVSDNGPGIPAERLATLFSPYERLDADRGPEEGAGLGLALSRQLMELMSGSIDVDCTGAGSRFTLVLPSAPAPQAAPPPGRPPRPEPAAAWRILHIDDDDAGLSLVRAVLDGRGEVVSAVDGETGLELAASERFDLVLLDLGLPGMTGLEVLDALRAGSRTRDLPIVVLSGQTDPSMEELALRRGAASLVSKPWDIDMLLRAVRDAIN